MVDRPGPDERRKSIRGRRSLDPQVKARVEQLVGSGMPMPMALAVAHGQVPLNEALEKLARREKVNRLMEKHQLSRALATQVALGKANLDLVLARRRLELHRETNRFRSFFEEAQASGQSVTLMLHGHRRVTGKIVQADVYILQFQPEAESPAEEIHKLQVKFYFLVDAYKRVRKVLKYHKPLEASPLPPIQLPQDRYTCSDRRLFHYMDENREVQLTTLEGELLRGTVGWFSRYEFALRIKGDAEVIVCRHALHDLREA